MGPMYYIRSYLLILVFNAIMYKVDLCKTKSKQMLTFDIYIGYDWAVYEVFERMAFYGITTNLVLYMTRKLHQGTVESANNVTNWVGTIWMTPILGAYVADAYLGRYPTFLISCAIYFLVYYFYSSFIITTNLLN